jgi:N-acetyl sugar amidotransferase
VVPYGKAAVISRCTNCLIPTSRPDTAFVDGVCSACIAYKRRKEIDWDERSVALLRLLERHNYECIVPSSGGKDSHYQVMTLLELGAKVTVVTASTCHLTPLGRANIDNLARHAPTIEVTQNRDQRAHLNRMGLELVGDISWPEHVGIFGVPFKVAAAMKIPLIFYGENPQAEYGGPNQTSQEAQTMTRRWVSEFGGFLGLRLTDVEAMTGYNLAGYKLPESIDGLEAHFLGTYIPWSSHRNAEVAKKAGMQWALPIASNAWDTENLDNAQTGLHDYMGYLKYGFGRGVVQMSIDVRNGHVHRDDAYDWYQQHREVFPETYAGVSLDEVLERIKLTRAELWKILDKYTNWDIFRRVMPESDTPPIPIFMST